jgi:asparagine synthase (glutamine-hydrolysing)
VGALVAVVDKIGPDVSFVATVMLETLRHRGSDAFGIASSNRVIEATDVEELRRKEIGSSAVIGHCLSKILPRDRIQPVQAEDFSLVFEGRLFPAPEASEAERAVEMLSRVEGEASDLVRVFDGAYVFAMARSNGVVLGRDAVGACPLYFGENDNICAAASERKALWKVGIREARSFPPGSIATVDQKGFRFRTVKPVSQPPLRKMDVETAALELQQVLLESAEDFLSDVSEVAVAFSGGVDSSVIAVLAKLCHVGVHLIFVGLEKRKEAVLAQRAAKALGVPLHQSNYSVADMKVTLPRVLWLIEEPNPVNASISVPLFWAAHQSAKLGFRILLSGQGADELFGGYRRYLGDYSAYGSVGLQRRLYEDFASSYKSNFQRDNKLCGFHKVELRMPFTDWKTVNLALGLPVETKILSAKDRLRKRVLRKAARKLGVPKFIAEAPKKAIQYTSGVNQAMKKVAKQEGLTLREYVEKLFRESIG